jgi:hypothetical protein
MARYLERLPGNCSLLAAREAWRLARADGVPSRLLSVIDSKSGDRHTELIFRTPDGTFFAYEPTAKGGSLRLGKLNGGQTLAEEFADALSRATRRLYDSARWQSDEPEP